MQWEYFDRMGVFNDGEEGMARGLDACRRYVFRYDDGQARRVVALEFDADFRGLGEARAPFPEWIRDKEYCPQYCGHEEAIGWSPSNTGSTFFPASSTSTRSTWREPARTSG